MIQGSEVRDVCAVSEPPGISALLFLLPDRWGRSGGPGGGGADWRGSSPNAEQPRAAGPAASCWSRTVLFWSRLFSLARVSLEEKSLFYFSEMPSLFLLLEPEPRAPPLLYFTNQNIHLNVLHVSFYTQWIKDFTSCPGKAPGFGGWSKSAKANRQIKKRIMREEPSHVLGLVSLRVNKTQIKVN